MSLTCDSSFPSQNARQDSNAGGRTREGSGPQPSYGGGNSPSYGGGARAPYAAGRTGAGGLAPYAFIGAGAGLAFWPGTWYGGAHMYQYPRSSTKGKIKKLKFS